MGKANSQKSSSVCSDTSATTSRRATKRKRTPEPTDRTTRATKRKSMGDAEEMDGVKDVENAVSLTINFTFDQFKQHLSQELRENRKEIAADAEKSLAKLATDLEQTKNDLGAYKRENTKEMQKIKDLSLIHI